MILDFVGSIYDIPLGLKDHVVVCFLFIFMSHLKYRLMLAPGYITDQVQM